MGVRAHIRCFSIVSSHSACDRNKFLSGEVTLTLSGASCVTFYPPSVDAIRENNAHPSGESGVKRVHMVSEEKAFFFAVTDISMV